MAYANAWRCSSRSPETHPDKLAVHVPHVSAFSVDVWGNAILASAPGVSNTVSDALLKALFVDS